MEVTIIRSNRKTVGIQVNGDLTVTVRAPMQAAQRDLERILQEKKGWIQKQIERLQLEKTRVVNCRDKGACRQGAGTYSRQSGIFCKDPGCGLRTDHDSKSENEMG